MITFLAIFGIIGASLLLSKAADLIVYTTSKLARRFHVSEFNMGFFILGLATTTPELFVGLNSAVDKHPELSLGNLIGASIVLLSLVIGLNAIIKKEIRFIESFHRRDMWFTSFVIFSPALFIFDGTLSRIDGLALISIYIIFYIVMNRRQTFTEHIGETLANHHPHFLSITALLGLGILGLILGAKLMVEAAQLISYQLQLPLVLVGLIMISIGTNLPELTVLYKSVTSRHNQLGMGDFLGSAAANSPVLGLIALFTPISFEAPLKVYFSMGMLFVVLITFNAFYSIDKKISRNEGVALVAIYSFFLFSELFLKSRI